MWQLLLRGLRSTTLKVVDHCRSRALGFFARNFQIGIEIGRRVHLGVHSILSATDDGTICLGDRAAVGRMSRVTARGGKIAIGDDVLIGDGCVIVSLSSIEIGEGTQLAEYVVVRDQDHDMNKRPLVAGAFEVSPIKIGRGCWLGAKVTVLRGSTIGDGAVIGAHSLVRGEIPANTVAAGIPAKVLRQLSKSADGSAVELPDGCPPYGQHVPPRELHGHQ